MTWFQRRGSKYGNLPTDFGGTKYDSKKEARYAEELNLRKQAGDIKDYQRQVTIPLFAKNGTRVCNYRVDFVVDHNDGTREYVEVKGFRTDVFNLKWKLFEDNYSGPGVKITMVT